MKKVAVFGKPGVGKSTLCKTLSQVTGLPLFQLDSIEFTEGGIKVAERGSLSSKTSRDFSTPEFYQKIKNFSSSKNVYILQSPQDIRLFLEELND